MSLRRFVLGMVAAAITVTSGGCAGEGPVPAEDAGESPPSAGVYAYLTVEFGAGAVDTESEMLVMDGTEEIGRSGPLLLADRPVSRPR